MINYKQRSKDIFNHKPISDSDFLTVLCPTRNRPDKLIRAIDSFEQTVKQPKKVDFWALVDDDDQTTLDFIATGWHVSRRFPINFVVGKRPATLSSGSNHLWQNASNAGIFFHVTDDYIMETSEWDQRIRSAFNEGPGDRLMIAAVKDGWMPEDSLTYWAASAEWANTLGRYIPPYFPFWFGDKWNDQIALMAGRKVKIDVTLQPDSGERGRTHAMWDLPYWTRVFHLLLIERIEEAERLLKAIHGGDENAYQTARAEMDIHVDLFASEIDTELSDERLQIVEQNFTAETGPPDGRYLEAKRRMDAYLDMLTPRIEEWQTQQSLKKKMAALLIELKK